MRRRGAAFYCNLKTENIAQCFQNDDVLSTCCTTEMSGPIVTPEEKKKVCTGKKSFSEKWIKNEKT